MTNLPSYMTIRECRRYPEKHKWSGGIKSCPFCAGLRALPVEPNSFTPEEYKQWEKDLGVKDDDWNMPYSEGGWAFRRKVQEEEAGGA